MRSILDIPQSVYYRIWGRRGTNSQSWIALSGTLTRFAASLATFFFENTVLNNNSDIVPQKSTDLHIKQLSLLPRMISLTALYKRQVGQMLIWIIPSSHDTNHCRSIIMPFPEERTMLGDSEEIGILAITIRSRNKQK